MNISRIFMNAALAALFAAAPVRAAAIDGIFIPSHNGAKGDGKADDTAAIQKSLDDAGAYFAKSGKVATVSLPSGNFRVTPPAQTGAEKSLAILVVPSGVTVQGIGSGIPNSPGENLPVTRIMVSNAGNYNAVFSSDRKGEGKVLAGRTRVTNVAFKDIWIDQDPARNRGAVIEDKDDEGFQFAILFKNFENVAAERVKFSPCTGRNTVHLAGAGCKTAVVADSFFKFVNPNADGRDYDNSAIYMEAKNQIMRGNAFHAEAKEGARGAMESHSGPAVVENNVSDGYMTGINITTTSTKLNDNNEDEFPAGYDNNIVVRNNRFLRTSNAIQLWSFSVDGSDGRKPLRRRLFNVRIENNVIKMAPKLHIELRQQQGRIISPISAIALVRGSDGGKAGGARDGDFENIFVLNNNISYPAETDANITSPGSAAALRFEPRGRMRNIRIEGNHIDHAPFSAILIGGGDLPGGKQTHSAISISGNEIVDAAYNTLFPDKPGYRPVIRAYGLLSNVRIENNRIVDKSNPPRTKTIFRRDYEEASRNVIFGANRIELSGNFTARETAKGITIGGDR